MNIGRQLKRVKMQADHLFLRSDRTDVVGELRTAEEQVDELRVLCEAYTRSLEKCLHTHTTPDEKKLRKVPEYQAAETLKEALATLPPTDNPEHQDLLRTVVGRVVELQQALGMRQVEYEEHVEKQVLHPLTHLIKDDFPSVAKQKKQLKQVGLDVDAAKTRWRALTTATAPGPTAKMDTYREELEDAETKLDQTRDSYACDIFSLLAREREVSQYVCAYISLQREHLQKSLATLDLVLPEVQTQMDASLLSPVFGVPLHDHLRIAHEEVAVVVRVCVRRLVEVGLYEEGLLRVAGSASKVRRLKGAFDAGLVTPERLAAAGEYDAHVVAGALKWYLRELPEPLMTHILHPQWLEAVRQPDHHLRLKALWVVSNQLPPQHLANLAFLIKFLALLAGHSAHNKMTPGNIAVVVAPNLLWDIRETEAVDGIMDVNTLGRSVSLAGDYRGVLEHLVEYCDYFFKDVEVDFGATPPPPPSPPTRLHHEANGALPIALAPTSAPTIAPTTAPARPAAPAHRRNVSADMTAPQVVVPDPCESPKQPQRTKKREKKQAPRPPQIRPISTHGGPPGNNGTQDTPIPASPEPTRSHTPPAPTPATRLHHTNSLRRPTAEPPKPPGAPVKPPRPSPPAPLGFEQLHLPRAESDSAGEEEVVIRHKGGSEEGRPIGFVVEGGVGCGVGGGGNVQAFRKSLESVLQQQVTGHPHPLPHPLPRHGPSPTTTQEGEAAPITAPTPVRPAAVCGFPPTPAQRTTIPATLPPPQRPADPKAERPAIKEKPAIMTRSMEPTTTTTTTTTPLTATLPRPLLPDRPAPLPAPAHHRPPPNAVPASYNLPPPAASLANAEPQPTTVVEITTAAEDKVEEAEEQGGGGSVQVESTPSVDKQQPTIIHVGGNPSPGPIARLSSSSSSSSSSGVVKFCWPPPHTNDPNTNTTTTTTATTTTSTTTITTEEPETTATGDSTNL